MIQISTIKIKETIKNLKHFLKDSQVPSITKKVILKKNWIIDAEEEKSLKIVIDLLNDCI